MIHKGGSRRMPFNRDRDLVFEALPKRVPHPCFLRRVGGTQSAPAIANEVAFQIDRLCSRGCAVRRLSSHPSPKNAKDGAPIVGLTSARMLVSRKRLRSSSTSL